MPVHTYKIQCSVLRYFLLETPRLLVFVAKCRYEGLLNNLATSSDFPRKKKVATAISSFIMHFRCCYIFLLLSVGKGGVHLPSIFEQGREEAGRGGTGSTTTIALLFERPRLGGVGLANYYNSFSGILPNKTKEATENHEKFVRNPSNPSSAPSLTLAPPFSSFMGGDAIAF